MRTRLMGLALLAPLPALAQTHDHHAPPPQGAPHDQHDTTRAPPPAEDHSEMDHAAMGHGPDAMSAAPIPGTTPGTGTSLLPGAEGGMRGLHLIHGGDWMVMAHGNAMVAYTDQGGPRGDDSVYSGSMAMLMAQREFAGGTRLRFTHQAAFFEGADGPDVRRAGWQQLLDRLQASLAEDGA